MAGFNASNVFDRVHHITLFHLMCDAVVTSYQLVFKIFLHLSNGTTVSLQSDSIFGPSGLWALGTYEPLHDIKRHLCSIHVYVLTYESFT